MRCHRFALLGLVLLGTASPAAAQWRPLATAHLWDATDDDNVAPYDPGVSPAGPGNGHADCPAGSYNGIPVPNKPAGGWFERLFAGFPNTALNLNGADVEASRLCAPTFNQYAENHHHGVRNARLATWGEHVYAVYDTSSGYHGGDRIKVQLNPEDLGPFTRDPYTLLHLARNPRHYVDVDHHSPDYDPSWRGADCTRTSVPPAGTYDPLWREHWGEDHELTGCQPPALTDTADPDIDIKARPAQAGADAFVVWIERYVDGSYVDANGATVKGFDPNHPAGAAFPYDDKYKVHAELIPDVDAAMGPNRVYGGNGFWPSPKHTALTGPDGLSDHPQANHYAPRITTYHGDSRGGLPRALVAFLEEDSPNGNLYLRVREWRGGTSWVNPSNLDWIRSCNPAIVSSGRATGHKEIITGTHDVATMMWGRVESPVMAFLQNDGERGCGLYVAVLDHGSWTWLGGDLSRFKAGTAMSPRIVVHDGVPFVTWSEEELPASNRAPVRHVYMRRYNAAKNTWDLLADPVDWPSSDGPKHAYNPAIAVGEKGLDVFVSLLEQRPVSYNSTEPLDGRVFFTNVYRCTLAKDAAGAYACSGKAAKPMTAPEGHLGVAYAEAIWPKEKDTWVPGPPPTQALHPVRSGWVKGFGQKSFRDGATDIVVGPRSDTGHPKRMWVSWPGAVQSHRNFDQGLYVREANPGGVLITEQPLTIGP